MSDWVKILNSLPAHPKILRAGDRAAWLYVCGLCYANEHLTDGHIPREVLTVAAPGVKTPEKLAAKLVEVGLWHRSPDGGWMVHDYADHQRTSAQVKETRRKDRERKARKESGGTFQTDSARNPNGIQTDSVGERERIPSETYADARSQEKRREEKNPHSPPGGKVVKFDRKPVPKERLDLAEAILDEFNRQAGTQYGAYTGQGKASEDLKRIIGALTDADPPVDLAEASRIVRWRLAHPYWQGRPHTGVVFGPNTFPSNRESARPGASGSVDKFHLAQQLNRGPAA